MPRIQKNLDSSQTNSRQIPFYSFLPFLLASFSGLIKGNATHSRPGLPIIIQNNLSLTPNPQAGGIPYFKASTKSSSCSIASPSPASPSPFCSTNLSSWSIGSLSSEYPFPTSLPPR